MSVLSHCDVNEGQLIICLCEWVKEVEVRWTLHNTLSRDSDEFLFRSTDGP